MGDELLLWGQRAIPARLTQANHSFVHPDLDTALKDPLSRPRT
jgi:NAD dependent epimerase/dehydratase family enzyme